MSGSDICIRLLQALSKCRNLNADSKFMKLAYSIPLASTLRIAAQ
ncbi:hypothetical protein CEV32_2156 [Brucella rhizosphaerae]|uniref:Uncharacterized protein n=1 Tax=Brucella rhizosphaerae TaxID=571254 RepID=A0A256F4E6_9HYPH|nr:hypothetical protein CEV32_2156 [Brucella rhizosphaerae]